MFGKRKTACFILMTFLLSVQSLFAEEAAAPAQTAPAADGSGLRIEFNISEPLGLLRFVSGISKQSEESQGYCDYLSLHHKLEKEDKQLIWQYILFRRSRKEFLIPSGRKLNLHQRLMASACSAKNFDDFFKAANLFCDDKEYATLLEVMNHFRPIYEQLIWKPMSPVLIKDLAWFRENEEAIARPLKPPARLFQSSAGRMSPLRATLVPVPVEVRQEGSGYHFISSALSENLDQAVVLSMEVIPPDTIAGYNDSRVTNNRTLEDSDGLVREFAHDLWAFRNPEFKSTLISYFEKLGTQFNYDLLDEAQATAVQAWFYKQVKGKEKSGSWHDNKYVDKYAKVLLHVIQGYENSGTLSIAAQAEDYARKAIEAFEKTFPDWQQDPQVILWRSQIVQSPLSTEDLADELDRKIFDYACGEHKISLVKGENWSAKFTNYSKNPSLSTIFLIHPNQLDTVQKYFRLDAKVTQELESLVKADEDSDLPIVKAYKSERSWLVFSIASKQSVQKQGLLDYVASSGKSSKTGNTK